MKTYKQFLSGQLKNLENRMDAECCKQYCKEHNIKKKKKKKLAIWRTTADYQNAIEEKKAGSSLYQRIIANADNDPVLSGMYQEYLLRAEEEIIRKEQRKKERAEHQQKVKEQQAEAERLFGELSGLYATELHRLIVQSLIQKTELYFSEGEVYVWDPEDASLIPLNQELYNLALQNNWNLFFEDEIFFYILSGELPSGFDHYFVETSDYIYTFISSRIPGIMSEVNGFEDEVKNEFGDQLSDFCVDQEDKVYDAVCAAFPIEKICDLLGHNSRYDGLRAAYLQSLEKEKLAKDGMLTKIPERIADLYPLARGMNRKFFLHVGPTNSGKTYEAIRALTGCGSGIYLAPLRLLAYEQYERLNSEGVPCSLLTGEERIDVDGSCFTASTIEMADMDREYEIAVIDEAQMITDPERGGAWTQAILGLMAHEIHVCTAPAAEDILKSEIHACGDELEVIRHKRASMLVVENDVFRFPEDVAKGDALIAFSRKKVHAIAADLQATGINCSIIYGALPYDARHREAERFSSGETDVLVATDAIGMGLNLPIRRIIFMETEKYDGKSMRILKPEEIRQVAGRAGRQGIFPTGYVNAIGSKKNLSDALEGSGKDTSLPVISMPRSLLGIDAPLSDTIRYWQEMKLERYRKADMAHEIALCRMAEKITSDKLIIYNFITMPFNEEDNTLLSLWYSMLSSVSCGKPLTFREAKAEYLRLRPEINEKLQELEQDYRAYDLLYIYASRYCSKEDQNQIMEAKKTISENIMHILDTVQFQPRKCKYCGKTLPWYFPYRICNKCYMGWF